MFTVELPRKPKPDAEALKREQEDWLAQQQEADARGDTLAARDYGARAERARRWSERVEHIPDGEVMPFHFSAHQLGDAVWATCGGEPYNLLQRELRRRFPDRAVLFSPVSHDLSAAYLLPIDRYGQGLYQEEPSILARGCLEKLIDAMADEIERLLGA